MNGFRIPSRGCLVDKAQRRMELHAIYLEVKPEDIAYIKFVFESYDGVGIIRTVDRKKATIVLLVVDSLLPVARQIVKSLEREMPLEETSKPADMSEDWFMREYSSEPD